MDDLASMDKKSLSERDICTKFISPAITNAGWDIQTQIREEVTFTKGRVIIRGRACPWRVSPCRSTTSRTCLSL
jgi:type I site-specific restriction endonuclease